MARKITQYDGTVHGVDSDYPDGDLKDNTGANDGTKINRKSNSDLQQLAMKMMRFAGITPNNLPDNEYNGLQLFEALQNSGKLSVFLAQISQVGTNDPDVQVLIDEVGVGTWTRQSTGVYIGPPLNLIPIISYTQICSVCTGGTANGFAKIGTEIVGSTSCIVIRTYGTSFSAADGILNLTPIECSTLR